MQLIFSFTTNPETKETVFAGNIDPIIALQIIQQIVIARAVEQAKEVKDVSTRSSD